MTTYYAHSAQDEFGNLLPYEHWQTLQSHSVNVGEMAAEFARVFGAQEIARYAGQLHDVGKYSLLFQKRLEGEIKFVDHSTAGAKIAVERWGKCYRQADGILHCGAPCGIGKWKRGRR